MDSSTCISVDLHELGTFGIKTSITNDPQETPDHVLPSEVDVSVLEICRKNGNVTNFLYFDNENDYRPCILSYPILGNGGHRTMIPIEFLEDYLIDVPIEIGTFSP